MLRQSFLGPILAFLVVTPSALPQTVSPADHEQFIFVSVTDKPGEWVTGLISENFHVNDGKALQKISSFHSGEEPVSVGIVIDTSASSQDVVGIYYDGISSFLHASTRDSEYFLTSFDEVSRVLLAWTNSRDDILSRARMATPVKKANSAVLDAINAALDILSNGRHRKKALIIFSDAIDNASKLKYESLRRKLRLQNVLLYNVNAMDEISSASPVGLRAQAQIDEWTTTTGGRSMYVKDSVEAQEASMRIANELKYQYMIGFIPTPNPKVKPDKWRKLEVKVRLPRHLAEKWGKLFIRTRSGYYPDPTAVRQR